jgi:hypothetical protein
VALLRKREDCDWMTGATLGWRMNRSMYFPVWCVLQEPVVGATMSSGASPKSRERLMTMSRRVSACGASWVSMGT